MYTYIYKPFYVKWHTFWSKVQISFSHFVKLVFTKIKRFCFRTPRGDHVRPF